MKVVYDVMEFWAFMVHFVGMETPRPDPHYWHVGQQYTRTQVFTCGCRFTPMRLRHCILGVCGNVGSVIVSSYFVSLVEESTRSVSARTLRHQIT